MPKYAHLKRTKDRSSPDSDAKYKSIFEHSAVSLWEEDISKLRVRLRELGLAGPAMRAHLSAHPEFVDKAVGLIEVTDVNRASLRLFEADRKRQLLGPLNRVLREVSRSAIGEAIIAIASGESDFEAESTAVTFKGRKLAILMKSHIPQAAAVYQRMLVSLIDITARKEAAERERQSANILQSIIESSPEIIFVKDKSLRMVLCNSALSHNVGKEPEETYGKTDIENGWSVDFVKGNPGKGIEGWEKDDLAVLAGKTIRQQAEPSDVDKGIRLFEAAKFPLRDSKGDIIGLIGIGRDVTDRLRLEAELSWERTLLKVLLDTLPDRIYFKDLTSRFIRVSVSHAKERGLRDPAEEIGKTDADYSDAAHAAKAFEDEQRIILTGEPLVGVEEKVSIPGRPEAWYLTTKMPFRNPEGKIVGTFGISHDITERRMLEEKNKQLAALVEYAEDSIVGLDLNRRITVWNKGAERMYGYSAEEMTAAPISPLVPPELEEETRLLREKVLRGEEVESFETTRLRKDGARITITLTVSAVRNAQGRIVGLATIARDITKQKAIEAQLSRAQRLEGLATLARGIAHQFNNIHTVVKGYLDLLAMKNELPEKLASYVEAAQSGMRNAVDITDRLLALTGHAAAAEGGVRLDVLARSVLSNFEQRIEREHAQLVLKLAETPTAQGEESRMEFVLSSLISNALDSLLDQPVRVLTVRTGCVKEGAFFEVQDTGSGIPPEDLPRIFSPFFTAKGEWAPSESPQARLKGVGLSLAISNTTVSQFGGSIDVQSTMGEGSCFRVLLPVAGDRR